MFGLADLGSPELGSWSLSEMQSVRLPFGMGIERDLLFTGDFPISVWAEAARETGSIRAAERLLYRVGASLSRTPCWPAAPPTAPRSSAMMPMYPRCPWCRQPLPMTGLGLCTHPRHGLWRAAGPLPRRRLAASRMPIPPPVSNRGVRAITTPSRSTRGRKVRCFKSTPHRGRSRQSHLNPAKA